ncbi:putative HIRA protein [Daphnia magna]|uniref:Putative HIRA protein n=1 Tax=Daphnia magna TaxID=35525 RepID=A0A162PGM0_9CRUS|nr:putative HIRA protein [Daphnia magna]
MKLLKPAWVTHDGKPIFSIDIHPDGSKFATGGQGEFSVPMVLYSKLFATIIELLFGKNVKFKKDDLFFFKMESEGYTTINQNV